MERRSLNAIFRSDGLDKNGTYPYMETKCHYQSIRHSDVLIYSKHGPAYFSLINEIIQDFEPIIFIELGTFMGGLTLSIHEAFPKLKINTFDNCDLIDSKTQKAFRNSVSFYVCDLLSNPNRDLVILLCVLSGYKKILYCDNGNKEKEINMYARFLMAGDMIGCHDWLWEIDPLIVKDALTDFTPYREEFLRTNGYWSRFWIKNETS